MSDLPAAVLSAAPAPSTPLGPFADSAVSWMTWVTLMGFVGVTGVALVVTGRQIPRVGPATVIAVTRRLGRAAAILGVLAVPALLTDLAHSATDEGGYDYGAAWSSLYDGTTPGLLSGLAITLVLAGAVLLTPLAVRTLAATRARIALQALALGCGLIALGTTKFPDEKPEDWGRTTFETVMWMLHLFGGAFWIGGLAGLGLLALPGAVAAAERGAFWARAIRRFSAVAMGCVSAIALSGLFLYWEHVDGPSQLLSTMYGRVLGVKILIFGALLLLGMVNQFWLHPRIEALRAAGDQRPLGVLLLRQFPAAVAMELLLGLTVLFVAPFLHGSARSQAHQAHAAERGASPAVVAAKLPPKQVSASTWAWGTAETLGVIIVMGAGYRVSGRLAGRRTATAAPAFTPDAPLEA